MRVLYLAEFDPCCVGVGWKRALAAHGIDLRVAVSRAYWAEGQAADWIENHSRSLDLDGLRDFAETADLLLWCPGIGQPWSYQSTEPRLERPTFHGLEFRHNRTIALVHGSRNANANTGYYADYYRSQGYRIAATTLDYVAGMDAEYLPPVVDVLGLPPADLRGDEPLMATQSPTDTANCHTQDFIDACRELGIKGSVATGLTHEKCLAHKRTCHAGFDHLRGSFSINAIESAGLGLVSLVGTAPKYRALLERLHGVTWGLPKIETVEDLRQTMRSLANDPELTRRLQRQCRDWYVSQWHPRLVAKRVAEALGRLAQ